MGELSPSAAPIPLIPLCINNSPYRIVRPKGERGFLGGFKGIQKGKRGSWGHFGRDLPFSERPRSGTARKRGEIIQMGGCGGLAPRYSFKRRELLTSWLYLRLLTLGHNVPSGGVEIALRPFYGGYNSVSERSERTPLNGWE